MANGRCQIMANDATEPGALAQNESTHSRRALLERAAVGVSAVAGAGALAGPALASQTAGVWDRGHSRFFHERVLDFIITQEQFGVTVVSEAVRRAPGTPSEQFLPVLRAAVATEFDHVRALDAVGAKPLTSSFWVPDAAFGAGGVGLFAAIEAVETIELSMYLVGVTEMTRRRDAFKARLCAEAMATESEHRVLARYAQALLGNDVGVPNNISFAPFDLQSASAVKSALEALGIGYGQQGATPGAFYDYPGDPVANGTGTVQDVRTPS
jgi:hypothetical protein